MKQHILFIVFFIALFFATSVNAEQITAPAQQFNKIFLNPFYRTSMSLNTNYTYNVTISPPDKISSVLSAIVTFNAQINGQTQNFTLLVNNQPCNNAEYSIATAFSTTGNTQIYFDCSNRITKAGNYTLILRSAVNTGTVQGWVDLTYMNNPSGGILLSGTEYSPNDPATMFVQLKDAYGNAVANGACYLDIWYPANASFVHPYTIQDAPMLQAIGDDGLYYYDMTAPSTLGVYMLSAKCSYSYNWQWIYPPEEVIYSSTRVAQTGTWDGSTVSLNSVQDALYDHCAHSGNTCKANYTFNVTQYGSLGNVTSINLYWAGQSSKAGMTMTFSYVNQTGGTGGLVTLPNTKVMGGQTSAPNGMDDFQSNVIPITAIINGTVKVQLSTTGGAHDLYNNWLSLAMLTSSGTIQDVKGSSEMHVTNLANATTTAIINNSAVAGSVWQYPSRNLTYTPDMTNYSRISNLTALDVWSYNNRTLSVDGITQIVNAIWSYSGTVASSILNQFANSTWLWTPNRNLTFYPPMNVTTQVVNITTQNVTVQNVTVNVTTQVVNVQNVTVNATTQILNVTVLNQTVSVQNVTVNVTTEIVNVTTQVVNVQNVTVNVTTQNVTVQNVTINNSDVASAVWNHVPDRNLTFYPPMNVTTEVVNITTQNVTVQNYTINVQNVTVNVTTEVVNVTTEVVNVTTQVVNVQNVTINLTTQNVTVQNVSVNESSISEAVWSHTPNRNLTYYENFGDQTNYSRISNLTASDVWDYNNRTLSSNGISQIVDAIWSYTGSIASSILDQFSNSTWLWSPRNLTFYPAMNVTTEIVNVTTQVVNITTQNITVQNVTVNVLNQTVNVTTQIVNVQNVTINLTTQNVIVQNVTVNSTEVTDAVWTRPDRNLTYYPPMTVTVNATVNVSVDDIANAVWNYNNTISPSILVQFSNKVSCAIINILNLDVDKWGVDILTC